MNKYFTKLLCLVLALFWGQIALMAQTNDLSPDDQREFQERVGQMLDIFQKRLSLIANKDRANTNLKKSYIKQTLSMFIGNGEAYTDPYGNQKPAVTMEISSLHSHQKRRLPVKHYLNNLLYLPYNQVDVNQAETYHITDWKQVGDQYVATATIFQEFIGYHMIEGRRVPAYRDITKKVITIYLIMEEDITGKKWVVRFGNVSVSETSPVD